MLACLMASGCAGLSSRCCGRSRLDNGYTIVLPGILGHNFWDDNVVKGLAQAKVPAAIEIHDWTRGPHMLAVNVLDFPHKRREADKIVQKIVRYQDRYPGRPVHLIGHSGGATLAVQVLETLPPQRKITGAVLLAPAMPRRYDLRLAQSRTEQGLHSFYSPLDVAIGQGVPMMMGMTWNGGPESAAMFGFQAPNGLSDAERRRYDSKLAQHPFRVDMIEDGHGGGHFGCTHPDFVQKWLAPIVHQEGLAQKGHDEKPTSVTAASFVFDRADR